MSSLCLSLRCHLKGKSPSPPNVPSLCCSWSMTIVGPRTVPTSPPPPCLQSTRFPGPLISLPPTQANFPTNAHSKNFPASTLDDHYQKKKKKKIVTRGNVCLGFMVWRHTSVFPSTLRHGQQPGDRPWGHESPPGDPGSFLKFSEDGDGTSQAILRTGESRRSCQPSHQDARGWVGNAVAKRVNSEHGCSEALPLCALAGQ